YGRSRSERRPRRFLVAAAAVGVVVGLLGWWGIQAISDRGGSPELSTDRVVRELRGVLENASSLRERIAICERFLSQARSEREREVVRSVASASFDELRGALVAYGESGLAIASIDAWVNDAAHWQDPDGYLARLEQGMAAAVGFRRGELPTDAVEVWQDAARSIEAELRRRMTIRDEEYFAAFQRHLEQDVGRRLGEHLAAGEFESARELLRDASTGFHGEGGRPQHGQLDGELRRSVDELSREFDQRWSRAIKQEERDVAEALRDDVRREISAIREVLAGGGVAGVLRARLDEFRERHLPGQYPDPDSFSRSANPWPEAHRELAALARDLWSEEQAHARRELSDYLQFGYRVLVSGSVEQAIAVVGRKSDSDLDRARVERHLALLRAAARVRDLVLERLIASAPRRSVPVRGGKVLVVRTSDGHIGLFDSRGERPLAFAIVAASLLDSVRGGIERDVAGDPQLAAGLALWFVVAADAGSGNQLVAADPDWQDFFATDVVRILAECEVPSLQDTAPATTGVLAELVRARDAGDLRKAEYWLGVVDSQHVLDEADRGVRDDVAHWIERESVRVARLDVLRRRAPEWAQIELADDGAERAEYSSRALSAIDKHAAWTVRGDSLTLAVQEELSLGQAWEERLELDAVVDSSRGVRADIALSLPDRGSEPSVVLIGLTGAACVVVVLPNGLVTASVIDSAAMRNPVDLRRALNPLLAAAVSSRAWAVAGARHTVSLELAGVGRTRFAVAFDDVELCEGKVSLGVNRPESLVLVSLQSVSIYSVRLSSPGR
ncbi:MAG: hypothetical protein KDB80_00220, partial [Planctomycetes bacterium]|nr:hypothetical protein [Planctomycetota bacterium]